MVGVELTVLDRLSKKCCNGFQAFVQLEGYFCQLCDFKTTQRSQFEEHKRTRHIRERQETSLTPETGSHGTTATTASGDRIVMNTRYFCCYCGLEQFETSGLLKHISVVHLKL